MFETRQWDYRERREDKHRHWNQTGGEDDGKLEWGEIMSVGRNVLFWIMDEEKRKNILMRDAKVHLEDDRNARDD